jgi:2-iminobutanoate/2-iminopropanoate deaminase
LGDEPDDARISMTQRLINPDNVHSPVMPYSHAVVAGDTIYLSAQLPLGVDGRLVGRDDIDAQAEQVFTNMRNVLEAAGAGLDDVVKLSTWLTSRDDRLKVMEVRNQFFGPHHAPSIIAVIDELPVEGARLQVDAIAVVDGQAKASATKG